MDPLKQPREGLARRLARLVEACDALNRHGGALWLAPDVHDRLGELTFDDRLYLAAAHEVTDD